MYFAFRQNFSVDVMNVSYKNFPFHLIGCTLFLFVGARTQSVKAVLTLPSVVEMHWRKNPKVFQETFEELFPQAESPNLWSEEFLKWFKEQNEKLDIWVGFKSLSFHTLDDLEKLQCDADLKKIIKVVGSTKFLEKVLPEEVVRSIFAHATGGEDFKTEITFQPRLKENFFNMFGKGELRMRIEQFFEGSKVLNCDFFFAFKKKNPLTVLTNYRVSYGIAQGGERWWSTEAEFLKKTERLSNFPWKAVSEAKNKFSAVYAKLRDDLKNNRKKYEDFKICLDARVAQEQLKKSIGVVKDTKLEKLIGVVKDTKLEKLIGVVKDTKLEESISVVKDTGEGKFVIVFGDKSFVLHTHPSNGSVIRIEPSIASLQEVDRKAFEKVIEMYNNLMIMEYRDKISAMDILITEDFLKGIFGEEFWNILGHYNVNGFYESRSVEFNVSPYGKGLKVSYSFINTCRGNRTKDAVTFYNEASGWKWIDFNYINFVFFYDPEKDEISHVRLQDKLVLNYDHRFKCNTPNGLIVVDNEDSKARCYSFEELLKKSGIHP